MPGKNTGDGAKGFVIFSILPKVGLADGTVITNQTGIYFDGNEVVLTDVTKNTLFDTPEPDANFNYKHSCSQTGLLYDFNYTGTTPNNATFMWNFEDGVPSTSTVKNPLHIAFNNNVGYKNIRLTVTRNGCTAELNDTIMVETGLSDNGKKVTICHNGNSLLVSQNALANHIAHGDCVGFCKTNSAARLQNLNDEQVIEQFNVQLLPNPSNDVCNISIEGLQTLNELITIEIYNFAGQLIKTMQTIEQSINLDTKDLNEGIYLIKVIANKTSTNTKLIIHH